VRPETSYASCGDLSLAYQVFGDGPVALVFGGSFASHIELYWTVPEFAPLAPRGGRDGQAHAVGPARTGPSRVCRTPRVSNDASGRSRPGLRQRVGRDLAWRLGS
jgi:hypothetical protein